MTTLDPSAPTSSASLSTSEHELVARLLETLSASLAPEEVARVAVAESVELLGAIRGSVALWDDEAELLEIFEPTGYGESGPPSTAYSLDEPNPIARVYTTGEPFFAPSLEEYLAAYPSRAGKVAPLGCISIVPLAVPAGGIVGTLNLVFPEDAAIVTRLPLHLEFARVVAQATDRARLYASERRARLQADAVVRVAAALSAAARPEEVAHAVVTEGRYALGAAAAFLVVLDEETGSLRLRAADGFPDDVTDRWAWMPLDANIPLAQAVRTGEPVWLETFSQASTYPEGAEARARSGYLAALVAPLMIDERAIGAVSYNFPGERHFTRSERNLALALASLGAHAFGRAALYDAADRARRTTESVVEHIPVGVTVALAPSGRIAYRNAAVEQIWRGPGQETRSFDVYEAWRVHDLDGRMLPTEEYPIVRAIQRGEVVAGAQLRIERMDGSTGFVLASAAPIHDQSGAIIAGVSAIVDISERVQSEALSEAFLGLLSHELRTPVTSILAASKLISRTGARRDEETMRGLMEDIESEAERLHRLVENLLVIARAERGIEFERGEPVLLQHLVPRALDEERRRWPDAHITGSIPSGLPAVMGEPAYLSQILSNLISNAAKYSKGRPEIEVVVCREVDLVTVRVLDRGAGIAAEEPEKLFEAFYRSPRTAPSAPGAGIGLFVVRQLVEAMDGRAWARPRDDGGSEFGFALPVLTE